MDMKFTVLQPPVDFKGPPYKLDYPVKPEWLPPPPEHVQTHRALIDVLEVCLFYIL
jgi:hypothetical protein